MILRGRPTSFVKSRRTKVLPSEPVPPVISMVLSVRTIALTSEWPAEATSSDGIDFATRPDVPGHSQHLGSLLKRAEPPVVGRIPSQFRNHGRPGRRLSACLPP